MFIGQSLAELLLKAESHRAVKTSYGSNANFGAAVCFGVVHRRVLNVHPRREGPYVSQSVVHQSLQGDLIVAFDNELVVTQPLDGVRQQLSRVAVVTNTFLGDHVGEDVAVSLISNDHALHDGTSFQVRLKPLV